jgi:ribonuclease HI
MKDDRIIIYTDGSCLGNPGKGGWGSVMIYKDYQKEFSGSEKETTNNRMEIKAVIESLKKIKNNNILIEIYTDSKYVKNGINNWIFNWKNNGWKTSNKKPVKNVELWKELDFLVQKYKISWYWVKGHDGNKFNEIADNLARMAAESF